MSNLKISIEIAYRYIPVLSAVEWIRRGKGAKDRIIQIPECLLTILTDYYKYYRPENYLFNGLKKGRRYSTSAAQWIMRQAKKNTKFTKIASIHTLRHAYATHHLESGTDLVYLKSQLGHKHLKTTERCIHLCRTDWS